MSTDVDGLPLATIGAVAKGSIPDGYSVSKEAKVALQRAAGVFVLYLTSAANDVCRASKRSTVSASDMLRAFEEIDMPEFVGPAKAALEAFKASEARRKSSKPPATKRQRTMAQQLDAVEEECHPEGAEAAADDVVPTAAAEREDAEELAPADSSTMHTDAADAPSPSGVDERAADDEQ